MTSRNSTRRFLSFALAFICLALGGAGSLRAQDVKFPADGSGITFTLPSGWKSELVKETFLRCVASDGFSVLVLPGKKITNPANELVELGKGMAESGKLTDVVGELKGELTTPEGLKIENYTYKGKTGDKAMMGSAMLFTTKSGSKTLLTYIASAETVNGHDEELTALLDSIEAAK